MFSEAQEFYYVDIVLSAFTCLFYRCVHTHMHTCAITHMWRLKDNFQKLVLSFHRVGPGDQTHVSLGGKHLYSLSHLTSPKERLLFTPSLAMEILKHMKSIQRKLWPGGGSALL